MTQEIQLRPQNMVPDVANPFAGYEPQAPPEPQGLKKLHRLLRHRYKWCVLLGLILAGAGVFAGYKVPRKQWSCRGIVRIPYVVPPILGSRTEESGPYDNFMQSQVQLMRSVRVITDAMDNDDWRGVAPDLKSSDPEAIVKFRDALTVTAARGEYITPEFVHTDPAIAKIAMRCLLAAYKRIAVDLEEANRITRNNVLSKMFEQINNERSSIASRITNANDLRPVYQMELTERASRERELSDVEVMLNVLPRRTTAQTRPAGRKSSEMTEEEIAAREPRLDARIRERDAAELELKRLELQRIGSQHPMWLMASAIYEQKSRAVREFVEQWRAANPDVISHADDPAAGAREQLERRKKILIEVIRDLNRRIEADGKSIAELDQLRVREQNVNAEYERVKGRIEALAIEAKNTPRINVDENPEPPLVAKDPRIQMACVGGALGLFLGFAIVLAYSAADRRLRSPEDMRAGSRRLALLGILPSLPDDLSDPEQAAVAAHCVHQIRTLLQIAAGPDRGIFAITSPAAGTGKTSLTLSMGVSFAAASVRTLIMDCDMVGGGLTSRVDAIIRRKVGQIFIREGLITPQQLDTAMRLNQNSSRKLGEILVELGYLTGADVARALAIQGQLPVGVLDALSGEPLPDCIAETGIQNLSILPLGAARPGDISKLSPASIRELLRRARDHFDAILIDTGPVPGSLEASIVTAAADAVVLIVSRGEHRPLAERSIRHLHEIGAHVAGLVFNRAQYRDLELSGTNVRLSSIGRSTRSVPDREAKFGPVALAVAKSDEISANAPRQP